MTEEHYRILVLGTAVSAWRVSGDGARLIEAAGVPLARPAPLQGQVPGEWLAASAPPDERDRILAAWRDGVARGAPFDVEHRLATGDGVLRLVSSRAVPISDGRDGTREWVGSSTEIGERRRRDDEVRQNEERLRLTLESLTDFAVFTTDVENRIETWNAGATRMFGYSAADAIGRSGDIIFSPEDCAQGVPQLEMRQAHECGRAEDERWHVRKDGTRFFASGMLVPLFDGGRIRGFARIARDLTERKHWEEALTRAHDDLEARVEARTRDLHRANALLDEKLREHRTAEERVRRLLARLITVQEDERRRIARDLHDHLGQQMTALRLHLNALAAACRETACQPPLEAMDQLTILMDRDLSFLAWELRPAALDDLGLPAALDRFVREWSRNYGIPAEFLASGFDDRQLTLDFKTSFYRIAQEALNNVYKHAGATRVAVMLRRRGDAVVLIVEDNGVGIGATPPASSAGGGLGLVGMQERTTLVNGTFTIESEPGKGTTILVQAPAAYEEAAAHGQTEAEPQR